MINPLRTTVATVLLSLAAAACLVGLDGGPAHGYVLEGPHVLDLMADKLSGVKTLRVVQKVTVEDPDISAEPVFLDETLSYLFPGHFRSEIVHQASRRILVVAKGRSLTIVDDKISGTQEASYDQYKDLLLYHSAEGIQKILYAHGVDVGRCSLGRLDDQIVFVIGANYPDESVSQLWVDKEQFFPLRWLTIRRSKDPSVAEDRWEFLYSGWQKVDGAYYPFKIETYHNGQRIRLIRVIKANANAVLEAELFNIPRLEAEFQKLEPAMPAKDSTPSGVDEVQRTIDDFKRKFEP